MTNPLCWVRAGAAIEDAVRQQVVNTIERIADGAHGYTDFAMGLARLLGFDLCPRLKSLSDRLLHVPVVFHFHRNCIDRAVRFDSVDHGTSVG